jgi:hypothetical protein
MSKAKTASASTSTATLLGTAFVVLKLCHVIDWSWWLVTLPFWGGFAVLAAILAVWGLGILAMAAWSYFDSRTGRPWEKRK